MRPILRWFLFTACLVVFTAAMLWISARILDLEGQRQRTAEEAQVQEKVRLALWRMDSLASALLIRENSRPAWHYQAFYAPDDLFASSTQSIPKGQALMPSPLFGSLPDLVRLNFEIVSGTYASPQAPAGQQRELASNWYASSPETAQAMDKLNQLRALLIEHPEMQLPLSVGQSPPPGKAVGDKAKTAELKKDTVDMQMISNAVEQTQRSQIITRNLMAEKAEISNAPLKKIAPAPAAAPKPEVASRGSSDRSRSPLDAVKDLYHESRRGEETSASGSAMTDDSLPARPGSSAPAQRQSLPGLAGDLRAVWADQELLLVRQASLEGVTRLQGVWLDWPLLQNRLLEAVRDLLPEAKLISLSPELARTDAAALVTLPVKLLTGKVPIIQLDGGSPLMPALAIAWACLIAAALAIAFVLHRAVLLSERRGAFVSAVTHELRTPLTTFRLYSEMLADDMVPAPERRREYLTTLCDESTRLMHLVENVLSFSRIERGRTAARMELVSVESLIQRIEPRLRQRTDQVGLLLKTDVNHEAGLACVKVDALAVEQVLFNLTDNACKYAAPDSDPQELHLSVVVEGREVRFTLRDFGPGLSIQARKKLFQPFAKSATEAAHSAPGVGLGLALCRRLARELGGSLTHQAVSGRGACFCLSLPRQA